jgi:hypothetical protein
MHARAIADCVSKTCATFYGPHSPLRGADMNPKSKIANPKSKMRRVSSLPSRSHVNRPDRPNSISSKNISKQSLRLEHPSDCFKLASFPVPAKNMCEVLLSAELSMRRTNDEEQRSSGRACCPSAPLSCRLRCLAPAIRTVPNRSKTPFCPELIPPEVARICMQLHATAYTRNFSGKTCAMFCGPQQVCGA